MLWLKSLISSATNLRILIVVIKKVNSVITEDSAVSTVKGHCYWKLCTFCQWQHRQVVGVRYLLDVFAYFQMIEAENVFNIFFCYSVRLLIKLKGFFSSTYSQFNFSFPRILVLLSVLQQIFGLCNIMSSSNYPFCSHTCISHGCFAVVCSVLKS